MTALQWLVGHRAKRFCAVGQVSCTRAYCGACRGAKWGSLRAAVQPMFHTKCLQTYAGTINSAVDALMTNLDQYAQTGEQTDIYRHLGRLTMQVISAAAFG